MGAAPAGIGYSDAAITVGNVVFNSDINRISLSADRWGHEDVHVSQWARFGGWPFISAYLAARASAAALGRPSDCNIFEAEAGFESGGYNGCKKYEKKA